jgi:hypothetical protein
VWGSLRIVAAARALALAVLAAIHSLLLELAGRSGIGVFSRCCYWHPSSAVACVAGRTVFRSWQVQECVRQGELCLILCAANAQACGACAAAGVCVMQGDAFADLNCCSIVRIVCGERA